MEARQVTSDQIRDIAEWCNGVIYYSNFTFPSFLCFNGKGLDGHDCREHVNIDEGHWIIKHPIKGFYLVPNQTMIEDYQEIQS
jgi:hypothetical protein